MHSDQLEITLEMVSSLIAEQFPQCASLVLTRLNTPGTVNAIFRLGDEFVVRLPLQWQPELRAELLREQGNCRRLQSALDVQLPKPVFLGDPNDRYPCPWSIYRWIPGVMADESTGSSIDIADQLADVVRRIRTMPTDGLTYDGTGRGGDLHSSDESVHEYLAMGDDLIDSDAVLQLWDNVKATARSDDPDRWTHGDLMPGNLLVQGHRLVAVIDVAGAGVRDPAVDLAPAWNLLTGAARRRFRKGVGTGDSVIDNHAWNRGKGWSLVQAVGCLYYYRETNPAMSETAKHTLRALLSDSR